MSNDTNEFVISELQSLAKKHPLRSSVELNRAKELMITLRQKGYTNNDISKLSGGAWSENTVKLYTRGTDVVDSTSKDEAVKIISEMVKSGLTLNEVSEAISLKDYLDAENISLEDIVSLLQDLKSSGLVLKDIIQLNRSIKVEGLSLKQLIELFMYKLELEKAGFTVEVLKQLLQASISFGDANLVIKAINEYGNLVALENEINHASAKKEHIQLDIEQSQVSLRDIQEKTAQQQELFKEYKELKELGFDEISLKQIKQIAISYGAANNDQNSNISFNSDDDSNSNNNNNNNKSVSSIPTKDFVNKAFQALNKFADISYIESEINNLQKKRTDVEAAFNKINSDYAHLQSLIAMCNTLLYDFKFSLPAIKQLYNVAKSYGKPFEVLDAIGKYNNLKSIERRTEELENKNIELEASVKVLEDHTHQLKGQADAIKSSIDGLLKPVLQEIGQSFNNAIQAITTTYQQQLSLLKNATEEYAKMLGAAVILEEELRLARIIMAIFKYPTEAKNLPIDYVILMLDAAAKLCRAKGINPKIKAGEASIVAENSWVSSMEVETLRLIEGAKRAIERIVGNAAATAV